MIGLSVLLAVLSAVAGYWLARLLNANIAGSIAAVTGACFLVVLLLAPRRGLVTNVLRRRRQRWEFAQAMLAIHLLHHEGSTDATEESRVDHLRAHLHWQPAHAEQVIRYAERTGAVRREGGLLALTSAGRLLAQDAMTR
jgi:manganese/zinc/iron transport system permease protein